MTIPQHEFNFGLDLLRATRDHGNRIAFQSPQGTATHARLNHLAVCFALHLRRRGVGNGSLVAVAEMDAPTSFAMSMAVALLGATLIHGTPAALRSGLRITQVIHASRRIAEAGPNVFRLDDGWQRLPEGLGDLSRLAFRGHVRPDAPARVLQSSGSTGTPKFMLATARMMALRLADRRASCMTAERLLLLTPVGTSMTFGWTAHAVLSGGRILHGLTPAAAVAAGVQGVVGSPRQIEQWLAGHEPGTAPGIAVAHLSGAAAGPRLRRHLLRFFRQLRIGYGSTEAGVVAEHLIGSDAVEEPSLGPVRRDLRVEIVDAAHRPLPAGEEGMIRIRTPCMVAGYLLAAPDRQAFRDGWFYPGDIGLLDGANRLVLVGRMDDRLNLGGVKIDAAAVDRAVSEVEGVGDCAAFAFGGDGGAARLAIAAVPAPSADEEALRRRIGDTCEERLGARARPAAIVFLGELPRNANGKVLRRTLSGLMREPT